MDKEPKKRRNKGGLGRGLNALLGDANIEDTLQSGGKVAPTEIGMVRLDQIQMMNTFQPRQDFNEDALAQLAASIKVHGIIQPLTVRRLAPNTYQLIAGERRYRAAKQVGLTEVPVFLRTADDEKMLEMALIENIQRKDLNPVEIAISYKRLLEELKLTQDELSEKLGVKRPTVTHYLGLLGLPEEVIDSLRSGEITMGHAKPLKGIENKLAQINVFQTILEKSLSVRQTEELVKKLNDKSKQAHSEKEDPINQIHLEKVSKLISDKLASDVKLKQNRKGKGQINISFNSTDDLNRILSLLDII